LSNVVCTIELKLTASQSNVCRSFDVDRLAFRFRQTFTAVALRAIISYCHTHSIKMKSVPKKNSFHLDHFGVSTALLKAFFCKWRLLSKGHFGRQYWKEH